MRRRQLVVAGATGLAVPVVSAENEHRFQSDLLEVVDYYVLGGNPAEEYIRLQNVSGGPLDMSNWTVEDDGLVPADTLSPFVFPSGFTLEPDAAVTIVTGAERDTDVVSGTERDTEETFYWGVERHVWSEEGDIVYVRDAEGELVLEEPIAGEQDVDTPSETTDRPM